MAQFLCLWYASFFFKHNSKWFLSIPAYVLWMCIDQTPWFIWIIISLLKGSSGCVWYLSALSSVCLKLFIGCVRILHHSVSFSSGFFLYRMSFLPLSPEPEVPISLALVRITQCFFVLPMHPTSSHPLINSRVLGFVLHQKTNSLNLDCALCVYIYPGIISYASKQVYLNFAE